MRKYLDIIIFNICQDLMIVNITIVEMKESCTT